MRKVAAFLCGWAVGWILVIACGCQRPIGAYLISSETATAGSVKRLSVDPTAAASGPVFVDWKCMKGAHTQVGTWKGGHHITLIGKGGQFMVTNDGWIDNNVENCLSSWEAYTVVEIVPPTSDLIFETEYHDRQTMYCWTNYATVGGTRGRLETGPQTFGMDPYVGTRQFGLGYDGTPRFNVCHVYGPGKWRIGYMP